MRSLRRTAVLLVAAATLAPALPAHALIPLISIADYRFTPATMKLVQGGAVEWTNDSATHTHTSTGDAPLKLWNTGQLTHGSTSATFTFHAAGTFTYHCAIHTFMHGTIRVPITSSSPTGVVGDSITISVADSVPKGFTIDVQRKRDTGAWVVWKTGVGAASVLFKPKKTGTYVFRSRLVRMSSGATSGWSPSVTVTIT